MIIAFVQDLVRLDGRTALVPQNGLYPGLLLQKRGEIAVERGARTLRAVHIAREAHHEALRAAFPEHPHHFFRRLFRLPRVDHRRLAGHPAKRV